MNTPVDPQDESHTGLPWLRSWRAVYGFVLVTFVIWLLALGWVMHRFA